MNDSPPPVDPFWRLVESLFDGSVISSAIGFLILFFFLCLILIPINVYFAQRHARLCRDELRRQTILLENILSSSKTHGAVDRHEDLDHYHKDM